jgi:alanine dehydrogenase
MLQTAARWNGRGSCGRRTYTKRMTQPIWLTEQEVVELLDLRDAIAALERALREEAAGAAANMTKTLLQYGKSNLHAIGGKLGNLVGTKSWVHTEGGTCPLLILWDAADGSLAAVIEAFALGNLRTGGMSGLATDWMAARDARSFAIVGTGKQSLSQVGAVLAVRPIEELRVFSPRAESRAAFVAKAREEFGIEALDCPSLEAACDGAAIVTLVTRAAAPFLSAAQLERGAHLNAVGAIAPDREEFAQDVFARATLVAVDDVTSVQKLSREFITRYVSGDWGAVKPLSQLIAARRRRAAGDDITLFKAMGMGISDLALGTELLRRAKERGIGRTLAQPRKAKPRLASRGDSHERIPQRI